MPVSKQLSNYGIANPGQYGLNTQDSPVTLPPGFLTRAENAIIDKKGRIASRKGREYVTTVGGTGSTIEQIFEAEWADGTNTIFSVGALKVYTGTATLTDITGAAVITGNDWEIVQLQDVVYFFQAGHAPLQYDKAVGALDEITAHGSYVGTVQQGTCVISAFGRLWTALNGVVYFSDLLNGVNWGGGTSGSIDIATVQAFNVDNIVGLASHNDFLIIFQQNNILIYTGATSPATMRLQDTISGVGLLNKETIVNTGQDVLFLDKSGFRSLGRTIQEKSSPIGSVSRNINDDLNTFVSIETSTIRANFSRTNRIITMWFPANQIAVVFDTQFPLEGGSLRVTTWPSITNYCGYETEAGLLYFGGTDGIMVYSDAYTDEGGTYTWRAATPHSYMDTGHTLKMGKELDTTTEGGNAYSVSVGWAWDYSEAYTTRTFTVVGGEAVEWGTAEFGVAEFGAGAGVILTHVKMNGSGRNLAFKVECSINGEFIALQEINVHNLVGRIY